MANYPVGENARCGCLDSSQQGDRMGLYPSQWEVEITKVQRENFLRQKVLFTLL